VKNEEPPPDYLGPHRFTCEYWMAGTLKDLGICNRYYSIADNRRKLKRHAVGWHPADNLPFRAKADCVALMIFTDQQWWTHLTSDEFLLCFPELAGALARSAPARMSAYQ
jgi:hypothetical protein